MKDELPLAAVLSVAAAGVLAAGLHRWRFGTLLVGIALLLAGGLRLSLRERQVGGLAVRSRVFDATVLLVLGFGLVVLGNAIPTPNG